MQEQFFSFADLPITPKRLEHFEPSYRPGTRDDLNGPDDYANIFDTIENRIVWEQEFTTHENARIAMVCERLILASIASRARHTQ
jgi:hypothetical protein